MIVDLIQGEICFLSVFLALPFLFNAQYLPDISFTGKSLKDQGGNIIFQLVCSTNIPSVECTTNFQVDQQTHDDIRFTSNACYHKYGICSQDVCNCSESCQTFTLNISSALGMRNRKFGCESRLKFKSYIFKAIASLKLDGNEFVIVEKIVQPIGQVVTSSNVLTTTSTSRDPDEEAYFSSGSTDIYIGIGVCCLVLTLISIVGIYCIWWKLSEKQNVNTNCSSFCKRRNADTEKKEKDISDSKTSANTGQNDGEKQEFKMSVISTQEKKTQNDPVSTYNKKTNEYILRHPVSTYNKKTNGYILRRQFEPNRDLKEICFETISGREKIRPRSIETIDDTVSTTDSSISSGGVHRSLIHHYQYRMQRTNASEGKCRSAPALYSNLKSIPDVPFENANYPIPQYNMLDKQALYASCV